MGEFYTFPKLFQFTKPSATGTESVHADDSAASSVNEKEEVIGDSELIRQLNSRRLALEAEHDVRMEDILVLLRESTSDLRVAYIEALGAAQELISEINQRRWGGSRVIADKEQALNIALERLRLALDTYKTDKRLAIVQPFLSVLRDADNEGKYRRKLPLRPLIVMSSFAAQLVVSSESLLLVLDVVSQTAHKRRKNRLWAPSSFRALGNFILRRGKGSETEAALGECPPPEITAEEEEEAPYSKISSVCTGICLTMFPVRIGSRQSST